MGANTYGQASIPAISGRRIGRLRGTHPGRPRGAAEAEDHAHPRLCAPNPNPLFTQSNTVVTIETDAGHHGHRRRRLPRHAAHRAPGRLIGQDPQYIERLWQDMSRSFFYPPGRELEDALGALDLALWDIRGKVLKLPLHQLLGGKTRELHRVLPDHGHRPGMPQGLGIKERAQLTIAAGYRAFRMDAASLGREGVYNTRERVLQIYDDAVQAREGVGKNGDWCIDFHQRLDLIDAVRAAGLIEPLAPLFVEDPLRAEMFGQDLPKFRAHDPRADRGRRGVGQPVGLQPADREPRHSITCAPRCRTSAGSPR